MVYHCNGLNDGLFIKSSARTGWENYEVRHVGGRLGNVPVPGRTVDNHKVRSFFLGCLEHRFEPDGVE